MKTILVADDKANIRNLVRDYLEAEGFRVVIASNGREALYAARQEKPDLILLDIMMPEMSGYDFIKTYRKERETPIILLTAKLDETDKVLGLELGADDYVTKPFSFLELMARVEAVLRRSSPQAGETQSGQTFFEFGDVKADFKRAEVRKNGTLLDLSCRELRLLEFFLRHRGEALAREKILDVVWDYDTTPLTRTVDMHVAKLRRKLEDNPADPRHIVTVHRIGYKFVG